MKSELPALDQAARRVRAAIEIAVTQRFARAHRYTAGADLRNAARNVARCVRIAWRDRRRQLTRVHELSAAVDDLKDELMLAADVKAFGSFAEFEMIARLVTNLGRQVGGWLKALHSNGQNGQAIPSAVQRASILSSRATPSGVNP